MISSTLFAWGLKDARQCTRRTRLRLAFRAWSAASFIVTCRPVWLDLLILFKLFFFFFITSQPIRTEWTLLRRTNKCKSFSGFWTVFSVFTDGQHNSVTSEEKVGCTGVDPDRPFFFYTIERGDNMRPFRAQEGFTEKLFFSILLLISSAITALTWRHGPTSFLS